MQAVPSRNAAAFGNILEGIWEGQNAGPEGSVGDVEYTEQHFLASSRTRVLTRYTCAFVTQWESYKDARMPIKDTQEGGHTSH